MRKVYLILLHVFLCFIALHSQSFFIGIGANYGGPMPNKQLDSSEGKAFVGYTAGLSTQWNVSKRIAFYPSIYYSYHAVNYAQTFTRDTMVTVVFNGQSGQVPTFYTAHVNGGMRLHYIDFSFLTAFVYKKGLFIFGPAFSTFIMGKDTGTVKIVIGKGGFFDDVYEKFDNTKAIRFIDFGLILGSRTTIYKNLAFELKVTRSLFNIYKPGKIPDRGQGNIKLFNTYVSLALVLGFLK